MAINSEITQQIYKARIHLLTQIKQRGFNTDAYEKFSINEVSIMDKNSQLDMILKSSNQTTYCKYLLHKSLRSPLIEEIIEELFSIRSILKDGDMIIIISQNRENDTIKLYLRKLFTDRNILVVHRTLEQLQFNILEHHLVPNHTILNESQLKDMQTQYNITNTDALPEISRFDPVVKAIMMKPGEVVHIDRASKTAISSDYYRVCINK